MQKELYFVIRSCYRFKLTFWAFFKVLLKTDFFSQLTKREPTITRPSDIRPCWTYWRFRKRFEPHDSEWNHYCYLQNHAFSMLNVWAWSDKYLAWAHVGGAIVTEICYLAVHSCRRLLPKFQLNLIRSLVWFLSPVKAVDFGKRLSEQYRSVIQFFIWKRNRNQKAFERCIRWFLLMDSSWWWTRKFVLARFNVVDWWAVFDEPRSNGVVLADHRLKVRKKVLHEIGRMKGWRHDWCYVCLYRMYRRQQPALDVTKTFITTTQSDGVNALIFLCSAVMSCKNVDYSRNTFQSSFVSCIQWNSLCFWLSCYD